MDNKIEKVEEIVSALENKETTLYFFTIDTKNAPNGEVKYVYDIAYNLHQLGYKVVMLHQEEEFVGPFEWLGERYEVLEHKDVKDENVVVSASDFLFIPEVYSNVMGQTKTFPCRRIMIYYNPSYFIDYMPVGATLADLNINDVITTNDTLAKQLGEYFPNINVKVIRPSVRDFFSTSEEPKKLVVNLLTPTASEVNDIIKPFYWKYPFYKWVSFRDLKGIQQASLADTMRDGAISVWVDDNTTNGLTALEALKSGSLLVAKVPKTVPEWMKDGEELRKDIIWVDSYDMLHNVLSSLVRAWTKDEIFSDYFTVHEKVKDIFTETVQVNDIKKVFEDDIYYSTISTFKQVLGNMKNNETKAE